MLKDLFCKRKSLETIICNDRYFKDSYKVIGQAIPSDNTFKYNGVDVSYQRAAVFLCIKISPSEDDYHKVWESDEYDNETDALNVLKAECRRISDKVSRRIEVIAYDSNNNEYIPIEVYNENNRAYLLAVTNA